MGEHDRRVHLAGLEVREEPRDVMPRGAHAGVQRHVLHERGAIRLVDGLEEVGHADDADVAAGAHGLDGLGDGVFLSACENVSDKFLNNTLFNILQATRTRISKTEYISCPSCGRTLFDLQETTAKIRSRTYHLKGVKIGIMGCIVNGPGEMADADYGYVGSGPGRINLYRGKEVVKRNVPAEFAVDELIGIIREDGQWIEIPEN